MAMRFRETDALLREAESREELVAALKGGTAAKEFRQEREALVKAVGGKKMIDRADWILGEAHTKSAKIIGDAQETANEITLDAKVEIKKGEGILVEKNQRLIDLETNLDTQRQVLSEREKHIGEARHSLESRKTAADDLDQKLSRRETDVGTREVQVKAREAEIKRFDDWRASAPV